MVKDIRYDEERIGNIVSDIHKYLKDLEEIGIHRIEDLEDKRNFYAASMILFSLLNRVFDLGSEMAIANSLGIPATYRDIFVLLKKNGFIQNDLSKEMIGLVTYRNLLSHEYHGLTGENLCDLIKKITFITQFVRLMQDRIQQK